jgi:hypothetical protein
LIVKNGYFPIALSFRTLLPSSDPENLKTAETITTFASSGEKEITISYFCFAIMIPK